MVIKEFFVLILNNPSVKYLSFVLALLHIMWAFVV